MELVMALAVVALLTRVGFALYGAGLVRAKNAASSVTRVLADFGFVVLAFWVIGAAMLYQQQNGWFGIRHEFLPWHDVTHIPTLRVTLLISLSMLLTATPAVAGALGERARFWPICAASAALGGFVLPVAAHWAWNGWLGRKGFVDVAGGCALHVSVGVFAAAGAVIARPRSGKFNRDGSSSMIPGHNVTLTSIGAFLLLVGLTAYIASAAGFNVKPGDAPITPFEQLVNIGSAAWNVLICAAAASVSTIVYTQIRYNKPDVILIMTGMLGGVVAIASGGSEVPSWGAALTGAVAGIIVPVSVVAIDLRARIDDPSGSIAIHGVGGAWGTLAVGLFIPRPITESRIQQIGIQLVGIFAIALFAALIGTILFAAFNAAGALRAKEADEFDGLDLAEHDIGAYPDFQQTTIKSYHLREA